MSQFLTQNTDADRLILASLDDRDLLSTCKINPYTRSLCNDNFFKYRAIAKLPNSLLINSSNKDWKRFYLTQVAYIEYLDKKFNFKYSNKSTGSAKEYYDILVNFYQKKENSITIENYRKFLNVYREAIEKNYLDLVEFMFSTSQGNYLVILSYLIEFHKNSLVYKILDSNNIGGSINENIRDGFVSINELLLGAIQGENYEMLDYLLTLSGRESDVDSAYETAIEEENHKMANYIRQNMNKYLK